MRVYLPASTADLELLQSKDAQLPGRIGFAMLPQWAKLQPDPDPEVLENELLLLAGQQSLAVGRRIVLVAEVPVQEVNPEMGHVSVNQVPGKQILAMFTDDQANKSAILAGADPLELDLTWFGPSEILEIIRFIGD